MIRVIEALNFRCLRYVRQELNEFQVLVGPNASGKSAFMDVVHLLGDLLNEGVESAIRDRSPNPLDLVWMGQGRNFEVAVELDIPEDRRSRLPGNGYPRARYEVSLGLDEKSELCILAETLWLKPAGASRGPRQRRLFPEPPKAPDSVILPDRSHRPKGRKKVITRRPESGNVYFSAETTGWNNPFRLGRQRLALTNLPEDERRFPVATWVKRVLMEGVQYLTLNSEAMLRPAPPGSPSEFQPDGSNLPWVIDSLQERDNVAFRRWVDHVRTAMPDVKSIGTVERPEDKHRYLQVVYGTGLKAPSWNVSDGTLRLLALTLLAYLSTENRVFLIEEPENGIHPLAVETVFQSLSSAYDSQILCATHSPVVLAMAEPSQVLCFARTAEGATDIVLGSEHPNLQDWRRGADLGTLFATGVLE